MIQTKKIEKCVFTNEWNAKDGTIYYHNVNLEGETEPFNIGSKQKEPDFLKAGQELSFKIKDEIKRTIVRVQQEQAKPMTGVNDFGVGAMVGNAITNAVTLIANGKVDIKDLETIARRICVISSTLKNEFAPPKE